MSLTLSRDELCELTQRKKSDAQAAMLDAVGIPYRLVHGRVMVARSAAQAWLEGRPVAKSREPNMGAVT